MAASGKKTKKQGGRRGALPVVFAALLAVAALIVFLRGGQGALPDRGEKRADRPARTVETEEEPFVPELILRTAAVEKGAPVAAADLVVSCSAPGPLSYSFAREPDTMHVGELPCTVVVTDSEGRSAAAEGTLLVCEKVVQLEASTEPVTAAELLKLYGETYAGWQLEGVESYTPDTLGAAALYAVSGEARRLLGLRVVDTTAPSATPLRASCYIGYTYEPEHFLSNIVDVQPVTLAFTEEPAWDEEGDRPVSVILTDASGNSTTITSMASFKQDEVAPVIYAAKDCYCYVGEPVSYFKEVFAEDNADPDCELEVDKSAVDYRSKGSYPVTYTATDRNGNSASVTVKFTFIEQTVTDEELDALAAQVLSEILTDDMSVAEQALAIYNYVFDNIRYIDTSDKTDWKAEAYRGLTRFRGDCFTYYAAAYLLLSKIDCEVLSVERVGGVSKHYWCQVNLGTGWYLYDACSGTVEKTRAFMLTAEQASHSGNYWRYDTSLYPPLATEPFEMF